VATFIGMTFVGMSAFGVQSVFPSYKVWFRQSLNYVICLVGLYVIAFIITAMAPQFASKPDMAAFHAAGCFYTRRMDYRHSRDNSNVGLLLFLPLYTTFILISASLLSWRHRRIRCRYILLLFIAISIAIFVVLAYLPVI
jgi:hypothetical protein